MFDVIERYESEKNVATFDEFLSELLSTEFFDSTRSYSEDEDYENSLKHPDEHIYISVIEMLWEKLERRKCDLSNLLHDPDEFADVELRPDPTVLKTSIDEIENKLREARGIQNFFKAEIISKNCQLVPVDQGTLSHTTEFTKRSWCLWARDVLQRSLPNWEGIDTAVEMDVSNRPWIKLYHKAIKIYEEGLAEDKPVKGQVMVLLLRDEYAKDPTRGKPKFSENVAQAIFTIINTTYRKAD